MSDSPASIPLAIVGMACRLPGAENLDAYWRLVIEGRSAVAEMPADRLNQALYFDPKVGTRGKTYSKLAATLTSRQFDRAACPISDELVRSVDIAHLLMCEVSAAALRHSRLDPFQLPERNVGVYIGHAQGSTLASDYTYATCVEEAAHFLNELEEYRQLGPQAQREILSEFVATIRAGLPKRTRDCADVDASLVAGTVSKAFGLTGPYLAINSACASSLQSILLAARALQLGRIEMAIAGGASDCKSDSLVLFAHAQAMSSTGSRPFDSEADGLICGEGYAAIVMKTLDRALADGDRVLAVIRGLGVASDGRGKSLWAPRKEGQIEAMRRAYRHGIDMSRLQYIEAHATATQLGDATELNTLAEALTGVLPKGTKIPVTSVKANIGHTLETAGIAGVIKAVLCMQNGMFAPAIGIRELNPKIDWANVPYYVPRQPTPWPAPADGHPRRAAVNAFGIGGLNMHVVIDQYTDAARWFFKPAPAAPQNSEDGEAIAIIGRGCILPGSKDVPSYWQMLTSGVDPKCDVPDGRWRTDLFHQPGSTQPFRSPTKLGGFVQGFAYDWKRHKVPPKQIAEADPLQFMLLDAADQAMREAGYDQKPFNRQLSGVVVGTEFGGDFAFQLQMGLRIPHMEHVLRGIFQRRGLAAQGGAIIPKFSATLLKKWPALIDETGSFSTSSLASRISKTWDMMGGAAAIDAGGSSALAGLAISIDMLLAGDVDLMVCAAGQRRLGLPQYEAQAINGTLATDGKPRSRFDAQANGHVPGEGVGVLLLKRLADARKDGDRVIGIIRGVGAGHSASLGQSLQLALDRSFAIAAANPADVAILEADGIATPQARDAELAAIAATYGRGPRLAPVVVGSQVSRIGHLDGAAGMASLVKATLEVEHGEMPAEAGLSQPAPQVAGAPQVLKMATHSGKIELTSRDGRRMAGVSTASRGLSYHAVLEYGAKVPVTPASPPTPARQSTGTRSSAARIVRFGGASLADVKSRIDAALPIAADVFAAVGAHKPEAQAKQHALPPSYFSPNDVCRLAIVADSPDTLAEKLKLAQSQLGNPASRNVLDQQGIFFRDVYATQPRIAFAFAGQGSQYTGMLKELVSQEPSAAKAVADIDVVLARAGSPTFAHLAWDETAGLGTDPWNTQASLLLADRVLEQTLAARGIRPGVVFGHSYGEYAALTAAGVWDLPTGLAVTRARVAGIEACKAARGGMLATSTSPDVIQQVAMEHRLPVYVANHNAADQTVVGGQIDHLQQLATHLAGRSIRSQMLPVPCPFHTPLMKDAVGPMQAALQSAALAAPAIPLVSVVTNEYTPSADAVRANLIAHNTTPVRYVDLIHRIADERPTVLVEVGPSQTLTRLHQRILAGKGEAVASDNPKRPGAEQLLHVQALLECVGALEAPRPAAAPVPAKSPAIPSTAMQHEIIQFDATARRREKMRAGGNVGQAPRLPSKPGQEAGKLPNAAVKAAEAAPSRPALPPTRIAPIPPPVPAPVPALAPVASHADTHLNGSHQAPEPSAKKGTNLNPQELEKFLINFVVEQTGYPPEVVELDADLEADLGIDSIKKAQLFGELQEFFDVTPTENLTLDDFPTLRHVLNFLQGQSSPQVSSPHAPREEPRSDAPPAAAPAMETLPAAPGPVSRSETATKMTGASAEELEKFLINFVVEQTGYPPEVVELDADLEADLGIDSIKKAQLFGELQEFFDITPTENLTLDDFPTLRHVLNFLQGNSVGNALRGVPSAASEDSISEEPPGAAPALETLPAAPSPDSRSETPTKMTGASPEELEKFLINFVVEQTGYPPEVVELDADLEADLGIDSIKKAQLFGELQEFFDITPTENLTLDDFPTLRHVLNFLQGNTAPVASDAVPLAATTNPGPAPRSEVAQGPFFEPEVAGQASGRRQSPGTLPTLETQPHQEATTPWCPASRSPLTFPLVRAAGSPREMGLAIGRERGDAIRRALCRLADAGGLGAAADDGPSALTEAESKELHGLAEGAGLPAESLLAFDKSVQRGLAAAATHFAGGCILPSPLSGGLQGCASPLVQVRQPVAGIPHVVVSLDGNLGGLCGVNAHRLVASGHPLVVSRLLSSSIDLAGAITQAKRLAGTTSWKIWLSQAGRAVHVECKGSESRVHVADLSQDNVSLTGIDPGQSDACSQALSTGPLLMAWVDVPDDVLWLKVSRRNQPGTWEAISLAEHLPDPGALPPLRNSATFEEATAPVAEIAPLVIPLEADSLATHRYVMRMLDRDLPAGTPQAPEWTGAALVVGRNPSADALRKKLAASGASVVDLAVTGHNVGHSLREWPAPRVNVDPSSVDSRSESPTLTGDLDATVAAFEALWQRQPIHHIFWMSHRDPSPVDFRERAVWQKRRHENVAAPFFVCQRWLQLAGEAKVLNRLSLVVGVAMGGDFGFSGELAAPDGGGLTGLLKAIYLEFNIVRKIPEMKLKAIDAPLSEPADQLAENVLRELASGTIDYEVAFVGGQRRLQTAIAAPAAIAPLAIRPGGNWVVTGGARGITAECIRPLSAHCGLVLHLVGTSPLKEVDPSWRNLSEEGLKALKATVMRDALRAGQNAPAAWEAANKAIEIDRALAAFDAAGVKYHYHVCDVCDRDALASTLAKVRAISGPIDGVLHGAGIDRACRFEKKHRGDVSATLGSKVDGAYLLMTLTWDDPIRHFIGFGSVSGRLGSNGQADYGQASDLLVKLVTWYSAQRPECHAIGFHWHPWDEVGMAYRPDTRAMLKMNNAPDWMPKREGIEHFLRELHAERHEHEVLITDRDYYSRFYKTGPQPSDVVHDGVGGTLRVPSLESFATPTDDGTRSVPATIAQRQVLRLVPAPLPAGSPAAWQPAGPVLIVGDNPGSQALAVRLRGQGVRVDEFVLGDDRQANLAAFDQHYASQLPQTVILMTARDAAATQFQGRQAWHQRRIRGVDTPFWLVQRWFKRLAKQTNRQQVTLVAATALGGDFGIGGQIDAPEGGALAGLCKSLYLEDTRRETSLVRVKVIDAPMAEQPESVAESVCRELAASEPEIEVGWSGGQRSVVRQAEVPLQPASGTDLPRGSVWVVTGGARGITAASVMHLGQRYGLKFHLVGKSPIPRADSRWRHASEEELKTIKAGIVREAIAAGRSPDDDWRRVKKDLEIQATLDRLAAAGVQATYHSCDTADWDGMERTLAEIRRLDGPITGVIHAAGYGKPGRFEMRDPVNYEKAVAGKVDGMVALMELTRQDPIRYFVAYGSISGRFGGNGFSDYAAANDLLAKLVARYRHERPEARAACLEWQTWDEVGMVNLGDSAEINKNSFKMAYIPPREGVMHLDRELRAGLPTAEVVITDGFFQRTFYPDLAGTKPGPGAPPVDSAPGLPLIHSVTPSTLSSPGPSLVPAKGARVKIHFDPQTDPFLIHHRMKDRPFLPGVVGMEAILEAAMASLPHVGDVAPRIILRDATIINGLAFHGPQPIDAHVAVTPSPDGSLACELTNEHRNRKGTLLNPARLIARAAVEFPRQPELTSRSETATYSEPPRGWIDYRYVDEGLLVHGPPLWCLKQYASDHEGGWGRIVAPALADLGGSRGGEGWILPVAVLDACVVACGTWVWWQCGGRLEVPFGFDWLTMIRHPRAEELCTLRFIFRGRSERNSTFDFTLYGDDQAPLLVVQGYQTVLVAEKFATEQLPTEKLAP